MKYSEKKAAQVAAYILMNSGYEMEIMKLMKLMYLAEREHVKRYGYLLTGDNLCSMPWGPVPSITYDLTKSPANSMEGEWYTWMKERNGNDISLRVHEGKFSELSKANILILNEVLAKFGKFTSSQLSDWTHKNCKEWVNPGRSSLPIEYHELAEAVGYTPDQAEAIAEEINNQQAIGRHI